MTRKRQITFASFIVVVCAVAIFTISHFLSVSSDGQSAAAIDAGNAPKVVVGDPSVAPPPGTVITVQPSGVPIDADVISTSSAPPANFVEYKDDKYGFSFYHAPESLVKVYDEGAGAETVVLENYDKARGFQVFIVPYSGDQITEGRFKKDVPSGVRDNVEETTLDGIHAVTFTSFDYSIGNTREIWAIRKGYLYEITTFQGVGQWFAPLISSWHFF